VAGTGTSCPTLTANLISISADGTTYCDADDDARLALATGVFNTGTASLTLPSVQIPRARVMLSCESNVFFALSDNDFSVMSATSPIASDCKTMDGEPLAHGTVFVSHDINVDGPSSGGGGGALYVWSLMLLAVGLVKKLAGRRQQL
jgi:hypothetical protein